MSLAGVEKEILRPMQQLFLSPRQMSEPQQREALEQYGEALQGFDDDVLAEAWREVRAVHARSAWPPIAAFVGAARTVLRARGTNEARAEAIFTPAEERASWMRGFDRFCDARGIPEPQRSLLLRPNLWWLRPKSEWQRDWLESEIPPRYKRAEMVREFAQ